MEMDNKNYDTILEKVRLSIGKYSNVSIGDMGEEVDIILDLGLDSLETTELAMDLEDRLEIDISEDCMDKFHESKNDIATEERRSSYITVGEFARYIHTLIKEKNMHKIKGVY